MNVRAVAVFCMVIGGAAIAPFATGYVVLNTTESAPVGLWIRVFSSDIGRGDYVLVDVTEFANYDRYRDYPFKRTSWNEVALFLKRVAGVTGDAIDRHGDMLTVNGVVLPHSQIVSRDRIGNVITPWPSPYTLKAGEIWLASQNARGFDSRYLGPASRNKVRKVIPLLIFP